MDDPTLIMDLYLDLQGAQTEGSRRRGIGRYTRDLAQALIKAGPRLRSLDLAWNAALHPPIPDLDISGTDSRIISSPYGALKRHRFSHEIYDVNQCLNDRFLRQSLARSRCRHIVFSSIMETEDVDFVLPQTLSFGSLATSYAIAYDIIPWLYPDNYLPDTGRHLQYQAHLSVQLSADILFSISEYTRQDIIRHLQVDPDRVCTIGSGIDLNAFQGLKTPRGEFLDRMGLQKPYLFFLGGDEFRKNLGGFIESLVRLPQTMKNSLQVLIAGRVGAPLKAKYLAAMTASGWQEGGLRFVDFMSEEDLRQAYSACSLTVVPSIYEGFGLPVLEAMACEAPVIAAGNSSMAEILKDETFLFNGEDPDAIADKISFVLGNSGLTKKLRQTYPAILAEHSWKNVVHRMLGTFEHQDEQKARMLSRHTSSRPSRSLDIAIWGLPLLGSQDMIKELCRTHLAIVYAGDEAMNALAETPCPILGLEALHRTRERRSPIISLVSTLASLQQLNTMSVPSEHMLIMRCELAEDFARQRGKELESLNGTLQAFHSVWLFDGHTLTPVHSANCLKNSQLQLQPVLPGVKMSTASLTNALDHETDFFELTNPARQAREFKQLLEKFGMTASLSKKVSELAAISRFERHVIS